MTTLYINNFSRGMAKDYANGFDGEFALAKGFDVLTYPQRLQPLVGLQTTGELTDTSIGKIAIGENGIMYAIGTDPGNPGKGELYKKVDFGTLGEWVRFTNRQLSGFTVNDYNYNLLVHFPESNGGVRNVIWSSNGYLIATDPDDGTSTATSALAHTFIGQGIVHPKSKTLYFPYTTATTSCLGYITPGGADFANLATKTDMLSPRYKAYCLSWFGDYLAIPMTTESQGGGSRSVVGLWDRDVSLTTLNESIPWGNGKLTVLNNIKGALIGVSHFATNGVQQNDDKLEIKVWEGGASPMLVKELIAQRLDSTTPAIVLNHRVNYVVNDRLYFSADITYSSDNIVRGLWSIGQNAAGEWVLTLEKESPDGTSVLAADANANNVVLVYGSVGQLARSYSGTYATSYYETVINPKMPLVDTYKKKKLKGVFVTCMPLPASASVQVQYRVDTDREGTWVPVLTETSDNATYKDAVKTAAGDTFTDGFNYEFRIISTAGAVVTGIGYEYETLRTQIT